MCCWAAPGRGGLGSMSAWAPTACMQAPGQRGACMPLLQADHPEIKQNVRTHTRHIKQHAAHAGTAPPV